MEPEEQEKIAIVSENRPEWLTADLAVQQTGAVLVPIYPTISLQEFEFILNQSEVRILLISTKELYERFQPAFQALPALKFIFSFDEIEGVTHWKNLKKAAIQNTPDYYSESGLQKKRWLPLFTHPEPPAYQKALC